MLSTRNIANIALGVAAMIAGGFMIFQLSAIFPSPLTKFMMMAPFMALMFYIINWRINQPNTILFTGLVFMGIMAIMNIFMGLAILLDTLFTHVLLRVIVKSDSKRPFYAALIFSSLVGPISVLVTKLFIGGAYDLFGYEWVLIIWVVTIPLCLLGVFFGKHICTFLPNPKNESH